MRLYVDSNFLSPYAMSAFLVDGEFAQAAAARLFSAATEWLAGGREDLFDRWSVADVDLALMLNRLVLNGDRVPGELAVCAEKQWQRPSVQLWVKQKRPPLEPGE
jgi:glutathione S-transferase